MTENPFYITWSKQKNALTYQLDSVEEHHLVSDNKKILDLSSISYQASFGLKPKFISDAVKAQADNFSIVAPKAIFDLKVKTTNKLIDLINLDGGKIFYTVSGAESVENALKIARLYKGKNTILARKPSYHGGTLGAISVTGDWRNQNVPTLDQWTLRIPEPHEDPDLSITEKLIKDNSDIAGIILETIPGNNGILIPPTDWIQGLQKLANKYDVLFILDEVICGFYRLGTAFGYQKLGLNPDIITLAKGITGGVVPFGAIWTNDKIHSHFNDIVLSCGLTSYAHPLGLAALDAVINYTKDKTFQDNLDLFLSEFNRDIASLKQNTRVIGALAAIDIQNAPSFKTFWDAGLSVIAQNDRIILAPHLNLPLPLWKESFSKLEKILEH